MEEQHISASDRPFTLEGVVRQCSPGDFSRRAEFCAVKMNTTLRGVANTMDISVQMLNACRSAKEKISRKMMERLERLEKEQEIDITDTLQTLYETVVDRAPKPVTPENMNENFARRTDFYAWATNIPLYRLGKKMEMTPTQLSNARNGMFITPAMFAKLERLEKKIGLVPAEVPKE